MRIAVATANGQNADEHFGTARSFQFYDIEGNTIELKETRSNAPWCGDNAETQSIMSTTGELPEAMTERESDE